MRIRFWNQKKQFAQQYLWARDVPMPKDYPWRTKIKGFIGRKKEAEPWEEWIIAYRKYPATYELGGFTRTYRFKEFSLGFNLYWWFLVINFYERR